jgi:flagellin FlaB
MRRRTTLRTGAAAFGGGVLASLAGCIGDDSQPNRTSGGRIDAVPAAATGVFYLDAQSVLADDAIVDAIDQRWSDTVEASFFDRPSTVGEVRDEFSEEYGLDLDGISEAVLFADLSAGDVNSGLIVWSEWAESDAVDAVEGTGGARLSETEYNDQTVYEDTNGSSRLGVLGDGTYVIGFSDAVEDAIDVSTGDGDSVGGRLRETYLETEGVVRFASSVDNPYLPNFESMGTEGGVDLSALENVTHLAGSMHGSGDERTVSLSFHAEGESAAEDVESVVDGGRVVARDRVDSADNGDDPVGRAFAADLVTVLDDAEVSRDGTTVDVTYTGPTDVVAGVALLPFALSIGVGVTRSESTTGEDEATEQVTNRVQVLSVTGTVESGQVDTVQLVVGKVPGAEDIDLSELSAQWVDETGTYDVVSAPVDGSAADGQFGIGPIKDDNDSAPVIDNPDDRMQFVFALNEAAVADTSAGAAFSEPLSPGQTATMRLVTAKGAASTVRLVVPDSLEGEQAVSL